jgi:Fe-S-cluster-containing hydrogenase component 2
MTGASDRQYSGAHHVRLQWLPLLLPYRISRKRFLDDDASAKSDFLPVIDQKLCTLSEECANVFPIEAVHHHRPHLPDGSDDPIGVRTELRIGCGDCASACPVDAIFPKKTGGTPSLATHSDMVAYIKEEQRYEGRSGPGFLYPLAPPKASSSNCLTRVMNAKPS